MHAANFVLSGDVFSPSAAITRKSVLPVGVSVHVAPFAITASRHFRRVPNRNFPVKEKLIPENASF